TQVALLRGGGAFHWDPYVACGIPGVGWAALISPFILIATFAVPLAWFYTALIFLKLNVAFFFAYAWLREERIGRRGAAICAIVSSRASEASRATRIANAGGSLDSLRSLGMTLMRTLIAVLIALMIAAPFLATFTQFIQRSGYLGARQNLSLTVFYPPHHLWN